MSDYGQRILAELRKKANERASSVEKKDPRRAEIIRLAEDLAAERSRYAEEVYETARTEMKGVSEETFNMQVVATENQSILHCKVRRQIAQGYQAKSLFGQTVQSLLNAGNDTAAEFTAMGITRRLGLATK